MRKTILIMALALGACGEPTYVPPVDDIVINFEAEQLEIPSDECPMAKMKFETCSKNMNGTFPNMSIQEIYDRCSVVAEESVEIYGCD